jgi:hypothetical protein
MLVILVVFLDQSAVLAACSAAWLRRLSRQVGVSLSVTDFFALWEAKLRNSVFVHWFRNKKY